jgi:hypothetical protein
MIVDFRSSTIFWRPSPAAQKVNHISSFPRSRLHRSYAQAPKRGILFEYEATENFRRR